MKLRKLLCLALALCLVCLSSCVVKNDETITGDVKEIGEISSADEGKEQADDEEADVKIDDESKQNQENTEQNNQETAMRIDALLQKLGCVMSDGGEYKAEAEKLCQAVKDGNADIFAEFTMGKGEYYDFLKNVEISSYTLYPFEFTDEKLQEMNETYLYPAAQDNYFVEFEVTGSECDEFKVGKNIYYFGLEIDPISGSLLCAFVPYEKTEENINTTYDTSYVEYFIDEFSALYFRNLYDGRNYPDSFDFSNSPHLITHLMARSPAYGEPPYTFDEVNEFITDSFDGNAGLSLSKISYADWTRAGEVYGSDEDNRVFGCSWGHGGTSAEHRIVNVEHDGDRSIYTVDFFADYSEIALAKRADFYFDNLDDGLVKLTMVSIYDDTGREIALISI